MAEQISDTKKIADEIFKNRDEHVQKIKELFTTTEICRIDEFYNNYQQEVLEINSEITPSKDALTLSDFKEIFETFESYPSNLKKPKKVANKDLNRKLSISRASSASEISTIHQSNVSPASLENITYEQGPTAVEIYSGFREFKRSLKQLTNDLKETEELEKDYVKKLQKLNSFSKDIEKLCDAESGNVPQAFTSEETATLKKLVENFENAIFINNNRNLFKENFEQYQSKNLDEVLELLSLWLNSVERYQEN